MPRSRRLALVAQLLGGHRFSSQEDLARSLARAGVSVTQATLSRDLRSLGVIKRPDAEGRPVYELPGPAVEALDRTHAAGPRPRRGAGARPRRARGPGGHGGGR